MSSDGPLSVDSHSPSQRPRERLKSRMKNKKYKKSSEGSPDIYQSFPDGWDFTPDVGNGQKRGEIFTPRFIVDKMISDAGIFPKEAVYQGDYSTVSAADAAKIVKTRVLEPAVGTSNFGSTILWHKLNYASVASSTFLELEEYFLAGVASLYSFDIDPGNLSTTLRRLLGETSQTERYGNVEYWVDHISDALFQGHTGYLEVEASEAKQWITNFVKSSLTEAETNWSSFVVPDGVVQKVWRAIYEERGGEPGFETMTDAIPGPLFSKMCEVLEKNTKLFNGIVESDSVKEGFTVPGWRNVVWSWWTVERTPEGALALMEDLNPLRAQILSSQLSAYEKDLHKLKEERRVERAGEETLFSLFGDGKDMKPELVWDSAESEKTASALRKKIEKTRKELSEI